MTMNQLMVLAHSRVLKELRPDKAYLDAADVKEERFGVEVKKKYGASIEIISNHQADTKYPIVSAASILAKTHRDRSYDGRILIPDPTGFFMLSRHTIPAQFRHTS